MTEKTDTIQAMLRNSFVKYADQPAIGFVGKKFLSYSDLRQEVESQAFRFIQDGVRSGEKVLILGANSTNWVISYFSVLCHGAVAVPVLPDFTAQEIENVILHSETTVAYVSSRMFPKVTPKARKHLRKIYLLDHFGEVPAGHDLKMANEVEAFIPSGKADACEQSIEPGDLASIIYTSGTTGSSKGVMLSHQNLAANIVQCAEIEPLDKGEVFLSILPLIHTLENTVGLLLPISRGASIHYLDRPPTASVLVPALKKVRPTYLLSVPMVIEKIYKLQVKAKFNKSPVMRRLYRLPFIRRILHQIAGKRLYETFGGRLKFFGIGGAKLDASTERFLREGRFPYAIGYGLTETSPLLAGDGVQFTRFQSTGRPVQDVELKIANPDPASGEGEIWARGKNIMHGYYKEPGLTQKVLTEDGWFKTGDLGFLDKENFLYIKGRLKNMIVGASGENIYPEEIETVINRFAHVLESVVVERDGKLVALVQFNLEEIEKQFRHLSDGAKHQVEVKVDEMVKELRVFVNERVNRFSQIQMVVAQTEPFEKTATKKIKRYLYK